jgi:hypothetical protein
MYQIIILVVVSLIFLYFIFLRPYLKRKKETNTEETKDASELITERKKEMGSFILHFGKSKKEEEEKRKSGTIYFSIIAEKDPQKAREMLSEINPKCFDFEVLLSGTRSVLICEILLEYFGEKLACKDFIRFEKMTEDFTGIHENNSRLKELSLRKRLERFPQSFEAKDLFAVLQGFWHTFMFKPDEKMKELAKKALLSFPREKFEFEKLWSYELARSKRIGIESEIAREIILRHFINAKNLETMFSDWYEKYYRNERSEGRNLLDVFFEALLLEANPEDCKGLFNTLESCGLHKFNEGILMRFMEKRGEDLNLWALLSLSERESTRVFKNKICELALSLPKKDVEYEVIDTFVKTFHPDEKLIEKLLEKYFPGIEESKKMTGKEFANKYELTKCEAV